MAGREKEGDGTAPALALGVPLPCLDLLFTPS